MKKNSKSYEYMQVEISTGPCSNCIEMLDEYGKDGWILVYMDSNSTDNMFRAQFRLKTAYFMREISEKSS